MLPSCSSTASLSSGSRNTRSSLFSPKAYSFSKVPATISASPPPSSQSPAAPWSPLNCAIRTLTLRAPRAVRVELSLNPISPAARPSPVRSFSATMAASVVIDTGNAKSSSVTATSALDAAPAA